ncbi:MAG: phosphoribosyltransferase [bacterium]
MKTLYTEEQIQCRIDEMAQQIVETMPTRFTLAPILTGGFVFAADLARAIYKAGGDPEIDFLQIASYGNKKVSSGIVKLIKDFTQPVEGKTILLVDDVLDSGRSLFFATKLLEERNVAATKICVAVDKKTGRAEPVTADFAAFEADADAFLVGYGMDDAGLKRSMPCIGRMS